MAETVRAVARVITPAPVVEGAGVHLRRSIGTRGLDHLDPFLLLDHVESREPAEYEAGFPVHPHRGIETVGLMRAGEVRHADHEPVARWGPFVMNTRAEIERTIEERRQGRFIKEEPRDA